MEPFADLSQARAAMNAFLRNNTDDMPELIVAKLDELAASPSPVDQIACTAELLYARRADVNDAAKTLCARLAAFGAVNGWHGLGGTENRGGRIMQAMQRDMGEEPLAGLSWPEPETDPEPRPQYAAENDVPPPTP